MEELVLPEPAELRALPDPQAVVIKGTRVNPDLQVFRGLSDLLDLLVQLDHKEFKDLSGLLEMELDQKACAHQ